MEDLESTDLVLNIAAKFKIKHPSLTSFEALTLALKFHKNLCILATTPVLIDIDGEEDDLTSQN